jgi:hypothetical protein
LIGLSTRILGIEDLEEIFLNCRYLLLLFEVLIYVSDFKVCLEIIPFLIRLVSGREHKLFDLELAMHVLEILVDCINKEFIK